MRCILTKSGRNKFQRGSLVNRVDREKKAYDEDDFMEYSHRWHMRFKHIFYMPNTTRIEKIFDDQIRKESKGKRVLEIGCGPGVMAANLIENGAGYIFGMDISEKLLSEAKKTEIKGRMEFALGDIHERIEGTYDVIFGRAILHHIDYRLVLTRLFKENLNPGGSMFFIEPLGANILMRLYFKIAPKAHTPDEKPFFQEDLNWFQKTFSNFQLVPINYLSLPLGILSSLIFSRPDNLLTRIGDRADVWIAEKLKVLTPRFRAALFIIKKSP